MGEVEKLRMGERGVREPGEAENGGNGEAEKRGLFYKPFIRLIDHVHNQDLFSNSLESLFLIPLIPLM